MIPAFATLTLIPFTFNIAHGVAGGIIFYVLVKAGAGRRREISRLMWVLAAVLVAAYAMLPRLRHERDCTIRRGFLDGEWCGA